jgi:CDP-glucose 4,6-dehydratase
MDSLYKAYSGKRVFVTGHTGFKGSWLCEWLLGMDSAVWGYSLAPATKPALFNLLGLRNRLHHIEADVRDARALERAIVAARPDYVFHLAAQPIVRSAHAHPAETWSTNVMGSVNVLEALRKLNGTCAAVIVTTDKVYRGSSRAHIEENPLGPDDPYGASKASVEMAVEAWRSAFFSVPKSGGRPFPKIAVATARSGNVIGGGDWAEFRLLPDCIRALSNGRRIPIRNPSSIRPWQHVLDPLFGYLLLASEIRIALSKRRASRLAEVSGPFNFGPAPRDNRPVRAVVAELLKHWPGKWHSAPGTGSPVEASVLRLDAGKAQRVLGWRPHLGFRESVQLTATWYRDANSKGKAAKLTVSQIRTFSGSEKPDRKSGRLNRRKRRSTTHSS